MNKRILAMLLAAMLTGGIVMTSCGDAGSAETTPNNHTAGNTETETETAGYLDALPEGMDLEGTTIRFLLEEGTNSTLTERSIMAPEDSADIVDAAVYNRNLAVMERLNMDMEVVELVEKTEAGELIRTAVTSGTDTYDVVGVYQYYSNNLAPDGLMMDLAALPYNDFTREYWGTDYMDSMRYKGIGFWATGDLALRYTGGMYCTFVNADMAADVVPDVDFFALVDEGQWTLDKYGELTELAYVDKNGNGEKDINDQFGCAMSLEDSVDGMAIAAMVRWSEFDENGRPQIVLDNERTYAFYEKLYDLVCRNTGFWNAEPDDNKTTMTMFSDGKVLMTVNKLFQSEIFLRNMNDSFLIIPAPMLDETQEHYNTIIHDSVTLFGVPKTNTKLEATSAALEALAAESYRTVTPAYYEMALKVKYTRDADSARMIDLVRENVTADFVFQYSASIADAAHIFRNCLKSNMEQIASQIGRFNTGWNTRLDGLLAKMEENAVQ